MIYEIEVLATKTISIEMEQDDYDEAINLAAQEVESQGWNFLGIAEPDLPDMKATAAKIVSLDS